MPSPLDSIEYPIECPKCGKEFSKTFGWIKSHPDFSCDCGQSFDTGQLIVEIRESEKALGDLGDSLGNL